MTFDYDEATDAVIMRGTMETEFFTAGDFTARLTIKADDHPEMEIFFTPVAKKDIRLSADRAKQREHFRVVQVSSMFAGPLGHDADHAEYQDAAGQWVRQPLKNENGFIFPVVHPIKKGAVFSLVNQTPSVEKDGKIRNRPTTYIRLGEDMNPSEFGFQGYGTRTDNLDDDKVGAWLWWNAPLEIKQGTRLPRFHYFIGALPPGSRRSELRQEGAALGQALRAPAEQRFSRQLEQIRREEIPGFDETMLNGISGDPRFQSALREAAGVSVQDFATRAGAGYVMINYDKTIHDLTFMKTVMRQIQSMKGVKLALFGASRGDLIDLLIQLGPEAYPLIEIPKESPQRFLLKARRTLAVRADEVLRLVVDENSWKTASAEVKAAYLAAVPLSQQTILLINFSKNENLGREVNLAVVLETAVRMAKEFLKSA